ncbi:Cthe_2314 family HEPN domain-containing protein [Bacillus sp. T3]|uniref:Cthe_2314 family HEPN domain-containing protein n=1 Tax=Bacillus sp. T3 TaxID=467262 RepID=UPI0029827447|nr:Cthe_2314 family HEPN domain-containing protein [Bacillus sp. T3]
MVENKNREVKYLIDIINNVSYNKNRFKLMVGNEKFLFGIVSGQNNSTVLSELMQYKTIYDTLRDLDNKIKLSFQKAINYAYSSNVQNNFSILNIGSEEEALAYYYIENALFRTSSLWDMLGQLYRMYYNININQDKVYYKQIFNPRSSHSNNYQDKANEINSYLTQENETDIDGQWKGNHQFVNNCRNKMTHRNSPNIATMSDFDINFKQHPTFLLKRIIEDYKVVSEYINEILEKIEETVVEDSAKSTNIND